MIKLSGYQITEKIYEGHNSKIYRGIRNSNNKPVVIKLPDKEYPSPDQLARFKQEFQLLNKITGDKIVKSKACLRQSSILW